MCKLGALITILSLLSTPAWAEGIVIEGQVLNKFTGVPLASAEVRLSDDDGALVRRTFHTDSNGYYSFQISEDEFDSLSEPLSLSAICFVRTSDGVRSHTTEFTHSVTLHEGRTERNLVIAVSRKLRFSMCEGRFFPTAN